MQQLLGLLTHLGNGMALLQALQSVLMGERSLSTFVLAAPLLSIAPDKTHMLRRPVSTLLVFRCACRKLPEGHTGFCSLAPDLAPWHQFWVGRGEGAWACIHTELRSGGQ